ncbi:MAG: Gmad2 immunoglobulin-like domain-containing protein [Dehalococcoidia bacterium]|nr:Gmad2 immunoglobulin-like domain-containing protein [Dehalococcoidia bacterium]
MLRRILMLGSATALLALGVACTSEDDATAEPSASPETTQSSNVEPVTDATLRNATIRTDLLPAGEVTLEDGTHSEPAAPGSASMVEFNVDSTVVDDFNDDGVDDGAMIVRSSGGGSGTFYDLYVFLASKDGPELVASQGLGDRIQVLGIESGPGGVTVVYLGRDTEAPMSEPPTIETTVTVSVDKDGSVSVEGSASAEGTAVATAVASETATETPMAGDACSDLAPEAADASFTFVTNVGSGDVLESGATVEGCSRTFESNVPWRLEDREGNVIAQSNTMGGGVDGPAPFEFTVDYSVSEAQIGHLFVGGEDPSDGAGFPPVLNQIPVVLQP